MPTYCVNRAAQPTSGDHEVHDVASTKGCLPDPSNRNDLGWHAGCAGAVQAAKKLYTDVNGCFYCALVELPHLKCAEKCTPTQPFIELLRGGYRYDRCSLSAVLMRLFRHLKAADLRFILEIGVPGVEAKGESAVLGLPEVRLIPSTSTSQGIGMAAKGAMPAIPI